MIIVNTLTGEIFETEQEMYELEQDIRYYQSEILFGISEIYRDCNDLVVKDFSDNETVLDGIYIVKEKNEVY